MCVCVFKDVFFLGGGSGLGASPLRLNLDFVVREGCTAGGQRICLGTHTWTPWTKLAGSFVVKQTVLCKLMSKAIWCVAM